MSRDRRNHLLTLFQVVDDDDRLDERQVEGGGEGHADDDKEASGQNEGEEGRRGAQEQEQEPADDARNSGAQVTRGGATYLKVQSVNKGKYGTSVYNTSLKQRLMVKTRCVLQVPPVALN